MSAPEQHAVLSASSAHRWIHCPPSARLCETLPESPSAYAEEGRLAHAVAELKLRKQWVEPMSARKYNGRLKKLQEHALYSDEMLRHADTYVDYISSVVHGYETTPYVAAEQRLDFGAYVPEGFGTGDCIVLAGKDLHVIDYKYGKGVPVCAEGNPQTRLYGLGAAVRYSLLSRVETVHMTIVQPRLDSISTETLSLDALRDWGENIIPVAQLAYDGKGDFTAGDWCRFCRAKGQCAARAAAYLDVGAQYQRSDPRLLAPQELADLLGRLEGLVKWADDVRAYALAACLEGREIPGYKAVAGRSVRRFADPDKALQRLMDHGYSEAMLYERRPLSLAALEKIVGKSDFASLMADLIESPPGKPTLVPASDKRDPFATTKIHEVFGGIEDGNE